MNQEEEQALEQLFKEMIVVSELGQSNSGGAEVYTSISRRLPYEFWKFMEYNASWVGTTVLDKKDLELGTRLLLDIRTFWTLKAEFEFLRSLEPSERSNPVRGRILHIKDQIDRLCSRLNSLTGDESFVVMLKRNPELNGFNSCFLADAQNEGMRIALSWEKETK